MTPSPGPARTCAKCGGDYCGTLILTPDQARWEDCGPADHGWLPSYGECYLCFLCERFGGLMEPYSGDEEFPSNLEDFYTIKPCAGPVTTGGAP